MFQIDWKILQNLISCFTCKIVLNVCRLRLKLIVVYHCYVKSFYCLLFYMPIGIVFGGCGGKIPTVSG